MLLRVSKDPADKAYTTGDYTVRFNGREVKDWFTADLHRRVVINSLGTVFNGNVEIVPASEPVKIEMPANVGFVGAGLVHVPDEPAKEVEVINYEPQIPLELTVNDSPGLPEEAVVVEQTERLPDESSQD